MTNPRQAARWLFALSLFVAGVAVAAFSFTFNGSYGTHRLVQPSQTNQSMLLSTASTAPGRTAR